MELLLEIWNFTRDVAFYLLAGFILAGLIRVFVTEKTIAKYLGVPGFRSVWRAALIGVPLPLCSCSVLPVAAGLRKQGASRAATTSFLISTPETGVDSLAVSYGMLDVVMTVVRPIAACVTAFLTGALDLLLNPEKTDDEKPLETVSCGCHSEAGTAEFVKPPASLPVRIVEGIRYSFDTLLPDLSVYLISGLVLAGIISYFLPLGSLHQIPGGQWSAILMTIGIGIPLYICATSSTPLAAALIAKGLSPGIALLLLLVGPATNLSALSVILRIQGGRGLVIYLTGIIVTGVMFCFGLDALYAWLEIDPVVSVGMATEMVPDIVADISGVLLCVGLLYGVYKEKIQPRFSKSKSSCCQ
jgi:uncharacterized protein